VVLAALAPSIQALTSVPSAVVAPSKVAVPLNTDGSGGCWARAVYDDGATTNMVMLIKKETTSVPIVPIVLSKSAISKSKTAFSVRSNTP
jgi:hypothetical protein